MLTENRYRNRNLIREFLNDIGNKHLKFDGYTFLLKAGIHIADRMTDREFPIEEFTFIMNQLVKNRQILVNIVNNPDVPARINFYGNNDYMIGVTFHKSSNFPNKYDIQLRTLYKERNAQNRERNVSVYKVRLA
ncbi:hypothetical protein [Citrobacter phage Ci1]|nr:hypothetical protein [Citrobacter phage Ci1]